MANVIVAFWTENGRVMYDAISENLKNNGNNVMYLDFHDFISFAAWGQAYTMTNADRQYLWKQIEKFNPDLILSFNNIFPHFFTEKLKCPVCVVDADTPGLGFWHRDILKENKDRYTFLGLQKSSQHFYEEAFGKIKNYLFFPPATMMKNIPMEQDINISFIGSNFLWIQKLVNEYGFTHDKKLYDDVMHTFDAMNGDYCNQYDTFKKKYFDVGDDKYARKVFDYFSFLSGIERINYLEQLSDLGLKIYGLGSWRELLYFDVDLAKCFDETNISNFNDNLEIYNRSKIAVNISHKQAVSSFSWRVMDIMASNSCLLMEDKPDWRDLFEKYISPDVLDAVIYQDRFDMRQKAVRLLSDEKLRKKCVAELNNAIEKNGRWEIRFASLEKFLGVKLLNNKNKNPRYVFIQREEPKASVATAQDTRPLREVSGLKKRCKNAFYLTWMLIGQIPVIDHFVCNSKRRARLMEKLHKWRR